MCAQVAAPVTASLLEATLDLLWRQWRAIGGAAAGGPVATQVDPEALCISSLVLEEHEPRLWITMVDWLRLGAPVMSVQRLKNLAAQFPDGRALLERLALTAVAEAKDARWRSLLGEAKRGRKEPRLSAKRRSAGPALQAAPALVLRLRAAFGVGVKADLLALLLGQPLRVSVSTAAAALGYSTPTVFRAFQDLRAAGFVRSADLPAAAEYWLDARRWYEVLGGQDAVAPWGFWREILTYVCGVLRWEDDTKRRDLSEYARGAALRELAARHEADLVRAGVVEPGLALPRSPVLADWRELHRGLAERLAARG
jgi:hypothetical protein